MALLIIATINGIHLCEAEDNGWRPCGHTLQGHHVTSVIAREGVILAGTTDGIYRSDDLGLTWQEASQGLTQRHVRWMAFHPDISDFEFAGTEPATIFISRDGGQSWHAADEGLGTPWKDTRVERVVHLGDELFAVLDNGKLLVAPQDTLAWQPLLPGIENATAITRMV
ncbi:MAG: hypothetical protein H0T73_15665 [Ardenticatenales bacterium]|nr:hypothetical protein [Ardenticatenales bacterium]